MRAGVEVLWADGMRGASSEEGTEGRNRFFTNYIFLDVADGINGTCLWTAETRNFLQCPAKLWGEVVKGPVR